MRHDPRAASRQLTVAPSRREAQQQRQQSRLVHALLAKFFIETLFVVALAVYFSYTNFNPYFRGAVDVADAREVAGWAVDEAAPDDRVEVQLYLNGHFISRRIADATRPDVLHSGRSRDAHHGFVFTLPPVPPGKDYEARVYALHDTNDRARRTLQQIGEAKVFRVTANDENRTTPEVWWHEERR